MRLRTTSSVIADLWQRSHDRLRTTGFRDKPTALASSWRNGFAERLIGSIRRECVGPRHCLGRDAFASDPEILRRLF
jgi:hypothetical protein